MAKKVILERGYKPEIHQARPRSILGMFAEGLVSIIFPPIRPKKRLIAKWYKSVETGRWVKVWVPEYR